MQIDLAWVASLRNDFLTLVKNLPHLKDYDSAVQLADAFIAYKKQFHNVFFEHFLNRDLHDLSGLSESDAKWYDKQVRSIAWNFYIELSLPITRTKDTRSEETYFERFKLEAPKWKARLQRKAQAFWKALKDVIQQVEEWKGKQLRVKTPSDETIAIEGFKVIIRGFEDSDEYHHKQMAIFREGLKRYRAKASKVAPLLIRKQCPIIADFKDTLGKGGEYDNGVITFFVSSALSGGPDWVAQALAHEMGHHIWRAVLSGDTQTFWAQTIKGDFGDLDVKNVLDMWPSDSRFIHSLISQLERTDPVLSLQLDAITHDPSYEGMESREDFQKLYDEGTRILRVPSHPITGYANKSPEEAFCETLGLLVSYGPRTVHEKVRWWLETALPGAVKTASQPDVLPTSLRTASLSALGGPKFTCRIFNSEWDRFVEAWAPRVYTFVQQALGPYGREPMPEILAIPEGFHAAGATASFTPMNGQVCLSKSVEFNPGQTLEKLTHEFVHGSLNDFPEGDPFYEEGVVDYSVWVLAHAPVWGEHREDMIRAAELNISNRRVRAQKDASDYDRKRWAGGVFASFVHGPSIIANLRQKKTENNYRW